MRSFSIRCKEQTEKIAKANGLPKDLKAQYHEKLARIENLIKTSDASDQGHREPITCSLVQSIGAIPIPGVQIFGHVIVIPEFGSVALGEIEVGERMDEGSQIPSLYFELTNVKMKLGCVGHGTVDGRHRQGQRAYGPVVLILSFLLACGLGCIRDDPRAAFDGAEKAFQRGDLRASQDQADRQYFKLQASNPSWALKFRVLEAECMFWRGKSQEALSLLNTLPSSSSDRASTVHALAITGVAYARLHSFNGADSALGRAGQMCLSHEELTCGAVARSQGILAVERGQLSAALEYFQESLSFARLHSDRFLEATALSNLALVAAAQEHFDEAKDQSDAAYQAAITLDARRVALVAQGNSGWASYRLGDSEKALDAFLLVERRAAQLGDIFDQENELTNTGYIYMDQRKFDLAAHSFQQALELAVPNDSKEDIYNVLRALARLALQTNDLAKASQYAERALRIAHEGGNHVDGLYPMLVQGQVAAKRGDSVQAQGIFKSVLEDQTCPVFLKWEAQHLLARLYEDEKEPSSAAREYRVALETFESARSSVHREDFQLSFLTNAAHIYDDYIHFLVAQGKSDDALRWADYNRARTLLEGLGLLSKESSNASHSGPPALNPREISRQAKGVLLFYWLGEKQSYLWAITPQKTTLFTLPPGADIEAMVQRYRTALNGPQDVLESSAGWTRPLPHSHRAGEGASREQCQGVHHPRRQPEQPEFRNVDRRRPKTPLLDRRCRHHQRQFTARAGRILRQQERSRPWP